MGGWVKTGTRLKIRYFIGALNRCEVGMSGEAMGEKGCVGGNWYTCGRGGGAGKGRADECVETV